MDMPGRGTPKVTLRITPALWELFGQAAKVNGEDRAQLLRTWIKDYVARTLRNRPNALPNSDE